MRGAAFVKADMGDLLSPPDAGMLYPEVMSQNTANARPSLFDAELLPLRRDRAQRLGFTGHGDFLHREVADLFADRLAEVTRPFQNAMIIGSGAGLHKTAIQGVRPDLTVHQLESSDLRAAEAGADLLPGGDVLPLDVESQDLILSALELHWQNDPVGQLVQMRRALRPDGLLIAAMFGGDTLHELRASMAEAEVEITGGLSPRIAPMGELRDLGGLLQRAGFVMPVADSERFTVSYSDPIALMHDLRRTGETNILSGRRRVPMRRDMLLRTAEIYSATYPAEEGRIQATFEIVFLTGWAPGPDQPQPKRPGSATARLADALGTTEHASGDVASPSPLRTDHTKD